MKSAFILLIISGLLGLSMALSAASHEAFEDEIYFGKSNDWSDDGNSNDVWTYVNVDLSSLNLKNTPYVLDSYVSC